MEKKIILSCPTLKKELLKAVEEAGFQGEVRFIPQSLHSSPMELQEYLQDMIGQMEDMEEILLSGENLKELKRPKDGFFLSHGWMEYMKNSRLDLSRILEEIEEYIQPLADMIDGKVSKVRGGWGILKKMAAGKIDDDFLVARKGETVKEVLQRERHMKSF